MYALLIKGIWRLKLPQLAEEELNAKIMKAIHFHHATTIDMNGSFAFMAQGFALAKEHSNRPDAGQQALLTGSMMSGAMIVYLFAMWDEFFEKDDHVHYFQEDERQRYYAFKHVRHVFAHNINGERKSNRPSNARMDRAEEFDCTMASDSPIAGVQFNHDKMILKFPDAFLECQNFLSQMALLLSSGRFSTIGAGMTLRSATPLR